MKASWRSVAADPSAHRCSRSRQVRAAIVTRISSVTAGPPPPSKRLPARKTRICPCSSRWLAGANDRQNGASVRSVRIHVPGKGCMDSSSGPAARKSRLL